MGGEDGTIDYEQVGSTLLSKEDGFKEGRFKKDAAISPEQGLTEGHITKTPGQKNGPSFEDEANFIRQYETIEDVLEMQQDTEYRVFREELQSHLNHCNQLLHRARESITVLKGLSNDFSTAKDQTSEFQNSCDALMSEQAETTKAADEIESNLVYFDALQPITRRLNAPGSDLVLQPDFSETLQRLDSCLAFMQENSDFKEAEIYEMRYRQCMTRALTLIRVHFVNNLKKTAADVQKRIIAKSMNDITQSALLFAKFKLDAQVMSALVEEIRSRCSDHEEYRSLLNECFACLFGIRKRLVGPIVQKRMSELQAERNLVALARTAFGYVKGTCADEYDLFCAYFPYGGDEIYECLESICEPLYDLLRPRIIHETQLSKLCELCTMMQAYIKISEEIQGLQNGSNFDFASLLLNPLQDTQTRLVFLTQSSIRMDIQNFKPSEADTNYPENTRLQQKSTESVLQIAIDNPLGDVDSDLSYTGWYPTLRRSISLLSKIYRLINSVVFDDLAHQIVHHCIASLFQACEIISKKESAMDGQLFTIRHLLILKEQIAAFDIEYVHPEVGFDFSAVTGAFTEAREKGALNGIYKLAANGMPRVVENMLDAKVELDAKLRNAINTLKHMGSDSMVSPIRKHKLDTRDSISHAVAEFQSAIEADTPVLRKRIANYIDDRRTADILVGAIEDDIIEQYDVFYEATLRRGLGYPGLFEVAAFVDWMDQNVDVILSGLERYNPAVADELEQYVSLQCGEEFNDTMANLALLKLYQFNPHLIKDETIVTNILVKALTTFPQADFSLCLHLLPANILSPSVAAHDSLADAVQKLFALDQALEKADYATFWSILEGDDLYADLVADCNGFEKHMRAAIAYTVEQSMREIEVSLLSSWVNLEGHELVSWISEDRKWELTEEKVKIPVNADNEVKPVMTTESVKFEQLSKLIKRAYY